MDISGWEFQFRKGLLELAVLNLIRLGKYHGYEILKVLKDGSFALRPGNLYTVLGRLEKKGYLKSHRERSGSGPMRKCYSLTESGRRGLHMMNTRWSAASLEVDGMVFGGK
jgi:PadR family transcriptional regulator, regulatory protein PadR